MASSNGMSVKQEKVDYQGQDDPFNDLSVMQTERSAPHELVREFISAEGIEGKTVLTRRQVKAFTALEILHDDYPELGIDRLKTFLLYTISTNGESRKGLLNMLKGNPMMDSPNGGGSGMPPEMKRSNY